MGGIWHQAIVVHTCTVSQNLQNNIFHNSWWTCVHACRWVRGSESGCLSHWREGYTGFWWRITVEIYPGNKVFSSLLKEMRILLCSRLKDTLISGSPNFVFFVDKTLEMGSFFTQSQSSVLQVIGYRVFMHDLKIQEMIWHINCWINVFFLNKKGSGGQKTMTGGRFRMGMQDHRPSVAWAEDLSYQGTAPWLGRTRFYEELKYPHDVNYQTIESNMKT